MEYVSIAVASVVGSGAVAVSVVVAIVVGAGVSLEREGS